MVTYWLMSVLFNYKAVCFISSENVENNRIMLSYLNYSCVMSSQERKDSQGLVMIHSSESQRELLGGSFRWHEGHDSRLNGFNRELF